MQDIMFVKVQINTYFWILIFKIKNKNIDAKNIPCFTYLHS